VCAWVGNQRSRGVVTARVRTDAIQSLHRQRQDLHQSTYPVPLRRSGLIVLSPCLDAKATSTTPVLGVMAPSTLAEGSHSDGDLVGRTSSPPRPSSTAMGEDTTALPTRKWKGISIHSL
jgi:hypothetical protein